MVRTSESGMAGSMPFSAARTVRNTPAGSAAVSIASTSPRGTDLGGREVIRADGIRPTGEILHLDFAHHADDRQPARVGVDAQQISWIARLVHPPAKRIAAGPESLRQPLVDDHDTGRSLVVAVVEISAAQKGCAHRLEIAGRNHHLHRRDERFTRLHLVTFGEDDAVAAVPAQGNDRRPAGICHAWNAANRL